MTGLGLSVMARFGLSVMPESDYREFHSLANPWNRSRNRVPSNYANREEYFVFLLTALRAVENSSRRGSRRAPLSPSLLRYTTTPSLAALQSRQVRAGLMPGDGEPACAVSLIVEAFGDAVPCANPEAIGGAIPRPDAALDPLFGRTSIEAPGDER